MTARQVRRLRQKLKLTQRQFAERLGVSVPSVYRWENGVTQPSSMAVRALRDLQAA